MAKGLLGKKIGMMSVWDENGVRVPVTAIQAGPCSVLQVKTQEKDGYSAVKIGFWETREEAMSKPEQGSQKASKDSNGSFYRISKEIRAYEGEAEAGQLLTVEQFAAGDTISVRGTSKGKGFQGAVKRYNFGGGRKTHGSTFHRTTGSIGAGTFPGEVVKGKKMPGHIGAKASTRKNVQVVQVDPAENLILVKGPVAGPKGSIVYLYQK